MSESLALRYRPREFSAVVGQRSVQVILRQMVVKDDVPSALLFDGSRGCGKTTTARVLAAALNCEVQPGPCGACPSCRAVFDGTSLDVLEIDAASNGLVGDIRTLREQVMYSTGGRKRVVLLDEAHSMSREAFNALLKTLEEPPPDTVFILLTTEPGRILETVLSRCMTFTFNRIPLQAMIDRLQFICDAEGLDAEPALLGLIAERADGGMRDAVMALDQVTRVGIRTAVDYLDLLGEKDFAPGLVRALADGDLPVVFGVIEEQMARMGDPVAISSALVGLLREVLVLQGGGTLPRQGEALSAREALARQLSPGQVFAAMRVLWSVKTQIRTGDDQRAALDLAAVMVVDALGKAPQAAPVVHTAAPGRKLSLADMAAATRP